MAARPRNRPPAPPTRRVLPVVLAAFALVAVAVGAYVAARQTALFALNRIQVDGAPPDAAAQVRATLRPYVGRSLVRFDAGSAARRLSALSEISGMQFDRAFPHTLKVHVRLERPVAVLRQGADAWLVSSSARVLRQL